MIRKLKKFWTSLDGTTVIAKRELFLEIAVAALAGLALGMIFTPKKTVTIGSHNCDNGSGNHACDCSEDDSKDAACEHGIKNNKRSK